VVYRRYRYSRSRNFSYRGRTGKAWAGPSGFGGKFGGVKLNLSPAFLVGAALGGLTSLDNRIPVEVKIAGACMPVSGRIAGPIKAFLQGMLIGDAIQSVTGFRGFDVPGAPATGSQWGNT
jgi:hypothetical protein